MNKPNLKKMKLDDKHRVNALIQDEAVNTVKSCWKQILVVKISRVGFVASYAPRCSFRMRTCCTSCCHCFAGDRLISGHQRK